MMTLVTVATAMTGNQNAIAGNGVEVEHLGTTILWYGLHPMESILYFLFRNPTKKLLSMYS